MEYAEWLEKSSAGDVFCTLSGRTYTKVNAGTAACAYFYSGSYTCPLLVSTDANAVTYTTSYDSNVFTYAGSIVRDGVTWYYSASTYAMAGNIMSSSSAYKLSGTYSTIPAAANALLDLYIVKKKKLYTLRRQDITKYKQYLYNWYLTESGNPTVWTSATLPSSKYWMSVCYGNGKFVAVATDTNVAAYSTDGITWKSATLPSSTYWNSVCYGNGKFVAVAYNSNVAAYSTDGITWKSATLPSSTYWQSVCNGNNKFVAVAGNVYLETNVVAYSTDGITWKSATLPSSTYWMSVCYGNGKFVAVATDTNVAAYSTDGITWKSATLPSSRSWNSVCYGNGKFVAVGGVYSATNVVAYSTDGITWKSATLPSSTYWQGVCYGNGKFVAVAADTNVAAYSTDGITWKSATLPSSTYWAMVCNGNNKFVAVGGSGLLSTNVAAYSIAEKTTLVSSNTHTYSGDYTYRNVVGVQDGTAGDYDYTTVEKRQYLLRRPDITKYYTRNVSVVGSLATIKSIVYGFSNGNYLSGTVQDLGSVAFEFVTKFMYNALTSTFQLVMANYGSSGYGIVFCVNASGNTHFNVGGTSWLGGGNGRALTANKWYWAKLVREGAGSPYKLYISEDGINYTLDLTSSHSTNVTLTNSLKFGNDDASGQYLNGSIDLSESYIKVNGSYVWRGVQEVSSSNYDYTTVEKRNYVLRRN